MKKRTKILSIILALVLVVGSVIGVSIVSSSAESFTDENGISWTLVDNGFSWSIAPADKSQIVGSIVIPDEYNGKEITLIEGNQSFGNCTGLTSITIPNSIKEIGAQAFNGCTGLTSITIPNSVEIIGNYAFDGCTGLTSITIPDSVTNLSGFNNCTNLTSVTLTTGINTIGTKAFQNCTGLTSITIPNSVTEIGANAFSGCTGLTSITIPDSVNYISTAFQNCTGLTSITIPDSVTKIDKSPFTGCTNLSNITLPKNITNISKDYFVDTAWYNTQEDGLLYLDNVLLGYKGTKPTGELVVKDGTTIIAEGAFTDCTGLTSITIPDSLTTIMEDAFYRCSAITEVLFGNSVQTIGQDAFLKCTGLTSITIPDSVTNLSGFSGCTGLTSITIPNNVTTINSNAFKGCTGLTSITIPDSVTEIGASAFNGCSKLNTIKISKNLTKIQKTAFNSTAWYNAQNNGLLYLDNVLLGYKGTKPTGELVVKDGTTIIAESAFQDCTGLTSLSIPNSMDTIDVRAFQKCTKLNSVTCAEGIKTISDSAFLGCTVLTSITIPNSVTEIERSVFNGCTNLVSVALPNSLTKINEYTFYDCAKLKSINLPTSLTTIDTLSFYHCKQLESIVIPDSVTEIGSMAFEGCTSVEYIYVPSSVINVDSWGFSHIGLIETFETNAPLDVFCRDAFYKDTITNIVLGDEIISLDSEFSNMESLESIVIPDTVTHIKDTALMGSSNVTITTTDSSAAHKYAVENNIPVKIIDAVSATRNVDFEVTCDKTGYEFTIYKVADLETTTNPYEVRYDSLIDSVDDEIFNGDSEGLLSGLDEVPSSELTEVVGTYSTDAEGASKLFEDLEPGIYYVRATNFPANVYWVQNSVFALPYYDAQEGWQYSIDPIPLATKVDESDPEVLKTITNSTRDNVNFTDVSLGETVNFEITASRVGSANAVESKDFRLNSYVVSDIMESGLTLNQNSFVVTLEDIDGNIIATLEPTTDYVVDIVAEEGVDTTFTVTLTPEYLQETEFYSSANVVIAYSAILNEYSTREFDGNYNTATNLTYSNKTGVSATVDGNTVYAYTFGIEVNKYDDAGTALAGSDFALYLTEADAKAMTNAIATGTSDDTGNVEFLTEDEDVIRLQSGTYYIVETAATEGYNRYTDVIPVTISVEYSDTEANGTYIVSAPENGVQLVEVKNSKVIIPNTGGEGAMYRYLIGVAFLMLAVAFVVLKKRNSMKATATK